MRKFLSVLLSILVFLLIWTLALFLFPRELRLVWAASGAILLILWAALSIRFIPSSKRRKLVRSLATEYQKILKLESDLKVDALSIKIDCPACKASDNLWRFLEDDTCPSCKSGLWTTSIEGGDEQLLKLYKKKEIINAFYDRVPAALLRSVRAQASTGAS